MKDLKFTGVDAAHENNLRILQEAIQNLERRCSDAEKRLHDLDGKNAN
jgi:hypothetical protein